MFLSPKLILYYEQLEHLPTEAVITKEKKGEDKEGYLPALTVTQTSPTPTQGKDGAEPMTTGRKVRANLAEVHRVTALTTHKAPCSYCNKYGHEVRECRERIHDEKQKPKETHTNNAQHLTVDKTSLMFTQNAAFATKSDHQGVHI
jgi:hypothetical protein